MLYSNITVHFYLLLNRIELEPKLKVQKPKYCAIIWMHNQVGYLKNKNYLKNVYHV